MNKKKRVRNETPKTSPQQLKEKAQDAVPSHVPASGLRYLLPLMLIFILPIGIYANTLSNGFVYDDEFTIVKNGLIKNFSNIPKLFEEDYFALSGEMSYRPIVTLSYFLDYALCGLKPWGYHLTNALLHAINGMLLYAFLLLLCKDKISSENPLSLTSLPLMISLLFVTHPVLTEAINAISFREDILVFLFYMMTLITYLSIRSNWFNSQRINSLIYLLSCLFYFLALLSKEMAVTLPIVIWCYELFYSREKRTIMFNRYNIGYIAITLFYFYLRFHLFQNPRELELETWPLMERLFTIPFLITSYLYLLILPLSLSADYVIVPIKSFSSPSFILTITILISIFTGLFYAAKREQVIGFGVLFFLVTLLPVLNIIPIKHPFAERYLYLPTVGFTIVAGSALNLLPKNRYIVTSFLILMSIYCMTVIDRNMVWSNSYSLWTDTAKKMPDSYLAHNNLGDIYVKQGRLEEGIEEFIAAIKIQPNDSDYHYNLGTAYARKGRIDEAIKEFMIAIELKPTFAEAHLNLGTAYSEQGDFDKAVKEYETALELRPDDTDILNKLGYAYYNQDRTDESIEMYKRALKLKPNHAGAHYNLGHAYLRQYLLDEAIREFTIVLKLEPFLIPAYSSLGSAFYEQNRIDEAIRVWMTALKLDPNNAEIRKKLEKAYKNKGYKR